MLTTLLESRSHHSRNRRGTLISAVVHASIILVAVYATASGSTQNRPIEDPRIHWVPTPPSQPTPARAQGAPDRRVSTSPMPRILVAPVEVPTTLPAVNFSALAVTPDDFSRAPRGDSGTTTGPRASAGSTDRRAYDVSEVESPVAAIGAVAPEYPSVLRASGVEGQVLAEFVVNELGRADVATFRVVSATNDVFAESVLRSLPRMRFRAARIGDRSVAQLVRQQFVFRLDR